VASKSLNVLKRRADFLFLMKNGQKLRACDWLLVNFSKNQDGEMRCGWTLPRQVGTAATRNKLKRWSRAYFRQLIKSEGQLPIDVNLVFRRAESDFYRTLKYEKFCQVLDKGLRQIEQRLSRSSK
jgi:ribonuclease P protein component